VNVNDCAWEDNRTDFSEGIAGGKEARLGTGPNLVVWSNRRCQSVPQPRLLIPFPLVGLQNLESSVAGSARLILLLADLSLVQRVLETKLSLCRSSPDRPHSPHIQPGGKITRTNYLNCDSGGPSPHRYRLLCQRLINMYTFLLLVLFLPPLVRFRHALSPFQS